MNQSVSREGKNSYLLQEEEENVSEETNDDSDVNAEANKVGDNKKDVVFTMKEEKNTLEYQETMNVYIEIISSKKQPFWRPIYEVIEYSYFEETRLFSKIVLNLCRNNPNETQNIPNEIKASF